MCKQVAACIARFKLHKHVPRTAHAYTHVRMINYMCREACKRQLGMVTYKVVPFGPVAGLIEWVQVRILNK